MAAYEIIHITSLDDPRLDAYTKLTERELRSVLEPEKGIFIAESMKVIERALAAGMQPVSFLLGERWLDAVQPLLDGLKRRGQVRGAQSRLAESIPFPSSLDLWISSSNSRALAWRAERFAPAAVPSCPTRASY